MLYYVLSFIRLMRYHCAILQPIQVERWL